MTTALWLDGVTWLDYCTLIGWYNIFEYFQEMNDAKKEIIVTVLSSMGEEMVIDAKEETKNN